MGSAQPFTSVQTTQTSGTGGTDSYEGPQKQLANGDGVSGSTPHVRTFNKIFLNFFHYHHIQY